MDDNDLQNPVRSETKTKAESGDGAEVSQKKKRFRKNTLEELRKKRITRKKKKQEVYKMSKKERKAWWKKKAVEPLQEKLEECKIQYQHEQRISAYYWRQWKEEKSKTMREITGSASYVKKIDRQNIKDITDASTECILGEGVFGKVTKKTYRGIPVAEKVFKTSSVGCVNREVAIISGLDHPVLPFTFGICVERVPYLLIMQFYGVDDKCVTLSNSLKARLLKTAAEWSSILYSIADGLQYMHMNGYLHNDLKGDNIVMSKQMEIYHPVIIDFGKSRKTEEVKHYSLTKSTQEIYKKHHKHIAPEVVSGTHCQSSASDVYAFGLIIASVCKRFSNGLLQELSLICLKHNPLERPILKLLMDRLSMCE